MASVRRAAEEAAIDVQKRQTQLPRQRSGSGNLGTFPSENQRSGSHHVPTPNVRSQIAEAPKRIDREKVSFNILFRFTSLSRFVRCSFEFSLKQYTIKKLFSIFWIGGWTS